jgi:predicted ABC-type sugar transport system permease subunit
VILITLLESILSVMQISDSARQIIYGCLRHRQHGAVTYLSGISTRRILIIAFVVSGTCSAFAGAMLAGYAGKAYQAMGAPYSLPAIAAVILGTSF